MNTVVTNSIQIFEVEYAVQLSFVSALCYRLTELWDYPKYGCPFKRGSKYFYFHNSGLQNQRYNIETFKDAFVYY